MKNNDLTMKIIRIKEEYIQLCKLYELIALREEISKHEYLKKVISYSINYLNENGFNFIIEIYKPRRKPKGFFLSEDIIKDFDEQFNYFKSIYYKRFERRLYECEYMELLLYIYAINNLEEKDLQTTNIKNWGIRKG